MSPEHNPAGDPCTRCGLPPSRHRKRTRVRTDYWREREKTRDPHSVPASDRIIAVDGEGIGRKPHRYIYLAAVDESGREWSIASEKQISTEQALDFLLELPQRSIVFGYGFLYDLTKVLEDVDDKTLYDLFRPAQRAYAKNGRVLFRPVKWKNYHLNYLNRQFTVRRFNRSVSVWDVVAFYQSTFVRAIDLWKVASKEEIDHIERMKEQRGQFDTVDLEEIQAYCRKECLFLAHLGRKLIKAHQAVDLKLTKFHGAGSTASAWLNKIDFKSKLPIIPEAMKFAIACAFFGGRFENRFVGPVMGPCFSRDLASAYPYAAYRLPCLLHGEWVHKKDPTLEEIRNSSAALCHWSSIASQKQDAWGPLPVRSKDGTIAFPLAARGGWCWKNEFLASMKLATMRCHEAWIFDKRCDCPSPFDAVPGVYLERMRLGKDGPGIVLKLALNSGCYGKLAQSRGLNPPYQSWAYAGMITSDTRAELLTAICDAPSPYDVFMLATDGLLSKKPLKLRVPETTGTENCAKPLGTWTGDDKVVDGGIFLARPGIYFPQQPTADDLEEMKGRGIGKKTLLLCNEGCTKNCNHPKNYQRMMTAWRNGEEAARVTLTRFVGAKTGITWGPKSGYKRREDYGDWIPYPVKVSFNPHPKRSHITFDRSLAAWKYLDWDSVPYDPALKSNEALEMLISKEIADEQPEGC